jgi:hypothetical protein
MGLQVRVAATCGQFRQPKEWARWRGPLSDLALEFSACHCKVGTYGEIEFFKKN